MSIDQAALIQTVYDTIFSAFIQPKKSPSASAPETLLSLEWPGQQLDASQYQNPWSPQNGGGSQFATEMFSALVDAIPLVDSVYIDSGVTVEEMYAFLLGATALPLSPTATGEVPINPVNTLLANAQKTFESTEIASAMQPALSYHASFATPSNWADPVAAQNWTSISINSNQIKKLDNSPFVRLGGIRRVQDGVWKLPKSKLDRVNPVEIGPIRQPMVGPVVDRVLQLDRSQLATRVARFGPMSAAIDPSIAQIKLPEFGGKLNPSVLSASSGQIKRLPLKLLEQIEMIALADQAIDQETKDLQISFRCCRVNFSRPWLLKSLLGVSGWTLPGQAPGSLSNGKLESNLGTFPLLPIGCIVIRDLQIRANWGKTDRAIATQTTHDSSVGFGPFSLSGNYIESGKSYTSSFDGITISSPGLQVLGWLNLVMPYSPPNPVS